MEAILLERPHSGLLPAYVAALRSGWSPSNGEDLSGPHLAAIEADAQAFLDRYDSGPRGLIPHSDGSARPPLASQVFWISDGSFCGFLSFRHQPGTHDLPDHVSGHIGYGVIPAKRGQGIATAALRVALPIAAAAGLRRVLITAHPDNHASRRVIERAGGRLDPTLPFSPRFDPRVGYWIATTALPATAITDNRE